MIELRKWKEIYFSKIIPHFTWQKAEADKTFLNAIELITTAERSNIVK